MNLIIGRTEEKKELQKALDNAKSELVAVTGRRRVGKTYLILNYLEKYIKLEIVGVQNAPMQVQLSHFMGALKTARLIDPIGPLPQSWSEAFSILQTCFQDKPKSEKVVRPNARLGS